MPDVLLIQPPIRDFYLTAKRTIPYGLACISAALEAQGFSVGILDCLATSKSKPIDLPPEMDYLRDYYGKPDISPFGLFHRYRHYGYGYRHVREAAKEAAPFLVGISSLFTAYADEALAAAEAVKDALPGCTVVMGGHHPTQMPEAVMRCRAVDYVIRGEGEAALPQLAKALMHGGDVRSVPGVVARTPAGGILVSPPAECPDLDLNPLPSLHLLNRKFYRRASGGSAVVVASRGCPMGCSYCSVGGPSAATYRRRSVRSVLGEIEDAVLKFGARFIDFEDENISLDRSWFMELLNGVADRFGKAGLELRAMNGLFPPSLDEDMVKGMKRAGFTALNLSLGTTCPDQLKRFRRPDVREAFDRAVFQAGACGMSAVGYIIVGAPGQKAMDSVSDLLYLARRRVIAGVSVFYPSPGSVDYGKCEAANLLPERFSLMRSTALPLSDTTTRMESVTLLRLGRILNFMKSLAGADSAVSLSGVRTTLDALTTEKCPGTSEAELNGISGACGRPTAGCFEDQAGGNGFRSPGDANEPEGHTHEKSPRGASAGIALRTLPASGPRTAVIDRTQAGKALLGMFLGDGLIRGMTPDGEIYEHTASPALCRAFIDGLTKTAP